MNSSDEDRQSTLHDKIRQHWKNDAIAQKLLNTGTVAKAIELLKGRERVHRRAFPMLPLDIWIVQAATRASHEPDLAETMTASQRRNLSKTIIKSAETLEKALEPFRGKAGLKWPLQPFLDGVAAEAALNERDRLHEAGIEIDEDTVIRSRIAVYDLLMFHMDEIFDALKQGAELFASEETIIKKPNDANAGRLYFIRTLTKSLCDEFGSPCRSAALAITSAFFDCSDLDEAALSKLAPRHRRKLSAEDIESLRKISEQTDGRPE